MDLLGVFMKRKLYLFWDRMNNIPEILDEDGIFYFFNTDDVAIQQNAPEHQCRNWVSICPMRDITPINKPDRFDIFDEKFNHWVSFDCADESLIRKVQWQCGMKNWQEIY